MRSTDDIIDSIDDRLRQLNEEIRTLTAARAGMHGRDVTSTGRRQRRPTRRISRDDGATGAGATAGSAGREATGMSSESALPASQKSPVRTKPRRPPQRGAVDVAAGRLEALLSEHGEMTTPALAERAHGNRDQILTVLRELEAAGRVRRSGQRRSTRWHVITDEERIQKRAAELAARSKTAG
jgi:hypothetical protein